MNRIRSSILLFFLFLLSHELLAQKLQELTLPIAKKMEWYGIQNKPSVLFVHFDKNIYTSNENVWFSAYLLESTVAINTHHTLSVSLLRNEDSTMLADEKFLIDNGLSFGMLKLPDSLLPGSYSLLAYTNLLANDKPAALFMQPIIIKSVTEPGFHASIKLAEKPTAQTDSIKLVFKADSKDILTLVSFADLTYTLGNGASQIKGKLKTDVYGGASFQIPFKKINNTNNRLHIKVNFKNEIKDLQLSLPVYNDKAVVRFFPEGGNLVEGNKISVGWEVRDAYGEPLSISGILYQNEQPVDTIQTNGYGMGRFLLIPEPNSVYTVKLVNAGKESTAYPLPAIIEKGPSLHIATAVCKDTLLINLIDRDGAVYYGMIHNYTENFFGFVLNMSVAKNRTFRIPLTEIPKGIATISLLDSMGRPVAERLFFAHYDKKTGIQITTGQTEYATRQKVKLDLQLKNQSGLPVTGLVSVACIQDNRIDTRRMTDIESYTYLKNELASLPFKKDPMSDDPDNLIYWEDVLLIKGWRRYTWPDLMNAKAGDTSRINTILPVNGNVMRSKKKVTKPFVLNLIAGSGLRTIQTDSTGYFEIKNDDMVSLPGAKPMLFLDDKYKYDHTIEVKDIYHDLAGKLASNIMYENFEPTGGEKNTGQMILKQGEKATTLAEVVVTASKKDGVLTGTPGRNECGDYVCQYNILNCHNHLTGTVPIEGREYLTALPGGGGGLTKMVYRVCASARKENKFIVFLKGIYTAKEFYKTDYTQINASEQMYLSTIYWNHSLSVNSDKPTELSFYTSDIAGKFRVVVQGVTSEGVVHGEYVFSVIKN